MTRSDIEKHLQAQYDAWAKLIYEIPRSVNSAILQIAYVDGTSGYNFETDTIVLCIPSGNEADLYKRVGIIRTVPDKWSLDVIEIELLHEMMHERQFKEKPNVSNEGRELFQRF